MAFSSKKYLAIDFETTPVGFFDKKQKNTCWEGHPRFARAFLASVSDGYGAMAYEEPFDLDLCSAPSLVFHNISFDFPVGVRAGVFSERMPFQKELHCTSIMARLLGTEKSYALKDLARTKLGVLAPILYKDVVPDTAEFLEYAKNDALYTAQLFRVFTREIEDAGLWILYKEIEIPFALENAKSQTRGILLDATTIKSNIETLKEKRQIILDQIGHPDINLNSPAQLQRLIFVDWNLPILRLRGTVSTSKKQLEKLRSDPRVENLLNLKKVESSIKELKTLSKMIDPTSGCIHTYINTLGADTGRCTSSKPNLQNINRDETTRELFISRPGHKFVVFDFSQIEPRVLAHFLGPGSFSNLFSQDEDFYKLIGESIFKDTVYGVVPRDIAKQLILANFYGMGIGTLAGTLNVSRSDAKTYVDNFKNAYPEIDGLRNSLIAFARKYGYVTGLLNRRKYFPNINSAEEVLRKESERQVLNAVVQGSATTLFKFKIVNLMPTLRGKAHLLLHIHDEVILECESSLAEEVLATTKEVLESSVSWFSIPIKVKGGMGDNWAEAKP